MPLSTLKLLLAWLWFFILLLSYYILKPIRDGIGSILSEELDFWYLVTFVFIVLTMAGYAHLVRIFRTQWLVFAVYQGFAACLIAFAVSIVFWPSLPKWYAGTFFVWVSVFNLCSVALFWSVIADLYTKDEGQQWFGVLAGAGSVGALVGSSITIHATQFIGHQGLILSSLVGIELSFALAWWMITIHERIIEPSTNSAGDSIDSTESAHGKVLANENSGGRLPKEDVEISPTLWQGFLRILGSSYLLAICLYVVLGKFSATYIYNNLQSAMFFGVSSSERRTEIFAQMNLAVQVGSMVLQYLIVSWLFRFIGIRSVLAIPCVLMMVLFGALYVDSSLYILIGAQIIQQMAGYGLMIPSQNLLFTVVPRHDKYVSKGFIDTIVFRFSDVIASKLCTLLRSTSLTLGTLSIYLLPILMVWLVVSQRLGREFGQANRPTI